MAKHTKNLDQTTEQFQGKFYAAAKDSTGIEKCSCSREIVNGAFKGQIISEDCEGVFSAGYQVFDENGVVVREGEIDSKAFSQLETWVIQFAISPS
jgi:hypothetical protein